MKSNMLKKVAVLFTAVLALCMVQCPFESTGQLQNKRKTSRSVSLEEELTEEGLTEAEFSDSRVLLLLKHDVSMSEKEYSVDDFPELSIEKVENLSSLEEELINDQLEAERTGDYSKLQGHIETSMLLNFDEYNRVLCLTLSEPGRDNVLRAVSLLNKRDDVLGAEPDFVRTPDALPDPLPYYYLSHQSTYLNRISPAGSL